MLFSSEWCNQAQGYEKHFSYFLRAAFLTSFISRTNLISSMQYLFFCVEFVLHSWHDKVFSNNNKISKLRASLRLAAAHIYALGSRELNITDQPYYTSHSGLRRAGHRSYFSEQKTKVALLSLLSGQAAAR